MAYMGTETSRVEVTIYSNGSELLMDKPRNRWDESGTMRSMVEKGRIQFRGAKAGGEAAIVAVSVDKVMGRASGSFTIDIKSPNLDLRKVIGDDDWVDIVFYRHDRPFHVMRGLVDDVRKYFSASSGATSTTYRISGRDFGKIFEQTPLWFDRVTKGNWAAAAMTRIFSESGDIATGSVATVVSNMMKGFLTPTNNQGSALWKVPFMAMSSATGSSFIDQIRFHTSDFKNIPGRSAAMNVSLFSTSAPTVWALAQEWADPMLCELYVDLVNAGTDPKTIYTLDEQEKLPKNTQMAVIIRDRPFLTPEIDMELQAARYFTRIPQFVEERGRIASSDVGRSGRERKNAFFFAPRLLMEMVSNYLDTQIPLYDGESIKSHGMRRMDATSRYISDFNEGAFVTMSHKYRNVVRDFHCMNHLFLNGALTLTYGRPDIKIGGRLTILGSSEAENESYYVEGVHHRWQLEPGIRTSVDVTRGWVGSDKSLVDALMSVRRQYSASEAAVKLESEEHSAGETSPATSASSEEVA